MPTEPRPQNDVDNGEDLKRELDKAKADGRNLEAVFKCWKLKRRVQETMSKVFFNFQ